MIKALRKRFDLLLFGGLALALAAGVLFFLDFRHGDEAIRARVEENIQNDFLEHLDATVLKSRRVSKTFKETHLLGIDKDVIRLVVDKNCRLVQWSNSELLPSKSILPDLCTFPNFRTLQDRNKIYYFFRQQIPGFDVITLIPIQVGYKVENKFLKPYIFLGRYNNDRAVNAEISNFQVYQKQQEDAVKVFDQDGNFVYCLNVPSWQIFTFSAKLRVLVLAMMSLVFLLAFYYRKTNEKTLKLGPIGIPGILIFILTLFFLRWLVFYFDIPNSYLTTELFSPTVLAIGTYSPSLGDLILNVLLALITIQLSLSHYRRKISVFYKWAMRKETVAWTVQCAVLTICGLSTWWFFDLMNDIIQHSTINFSFSNVFELDVFSYLAFAVLGMILVALELVLLEALRFSFHFFSSKGGVLKVILSLLWLCGLSFILFGIKPAYLVSVPLVFGLSILIFVRTNRTQTFRLDLFNFLLIISIFSLLTTIGIAKGEQNRERVEMEQVADRQSDEHDLITESLFERVVNEVQAEAFVLDYSKMTGLAKRLKERFFDSNFKGYDVHIFLYDSEFQLRDKSGDYRPYIYPQTDPPLEQQGRATMTDSLYMVAYYKGLFESIYIGKFDLLLRNLGNILVWVELYPTEIRPDRLYPQLLLDDHVRSKEAISSHYDYAVYKGGRLFRKHSDDPFPIFYDGPSRLDTLHYIYSRDEAYDNLYYRVTDDKVVHVRTASTSLFDAANTFSFVVYFFVLAVILVMIPFWILRIIRNPRRLRYLSLKAKIQIFFLSFSLLPLFVVVFFLSPYIRAHIFSDIRRDLQTQTQLVANQIREDYIRLRRSNAYSTMHMAVRKKMRSDLLSKLTNIEKSFFNDINIYYSNGELHLTTQPAIYELGLTSEYMNPGVYRQIRTGRVSDIVIEDRIGDINYFSGFYPIMNDSRRIIGFLNIPYFKNQDQVNQQSLSLLTLLVNIYVFIFLAIGIIAVLVSNSIIRPLAILSKKLEATRLGRRNEPIQWETQDEIGEIIRSYNQMLEMLADSEEKLARTQREMAWQEMARQVAHEIKNPLTPMRLSVQHLVRTWNRDKPENEKLDRLFSKVTGTILVQIESLVNIANSFSQFGKMPEPQRSTFHLREVVQEVANLYSHNESVQLKLYIEGADFYVHSDRDQLSRVFNNLVKNAIQAIDNDHGVVELRMNVEGDLATVSIKDNGKGIPPEIAARIFEPKFSTKSSGMGLGLAIVKKIIEGAGGRIYFESEAGKGTTFYVELPRAEQKAD